MLSPIDKIIPVMSGRGVSEQRDGKRVKNRLRRFASAIGLGLVLGLVPSAAAWAQSPTGAEYTPGKPVLMADGEMRSPAANELDVQEHLGEYIDFELRFTDENGKSVRLGDYFDGRRPVLLTMNYYRCPVLCNVQLNGLTETLRGMDWTPGDENFRVVTVSIDPRETPELAAKKRKGHLTSLERGDDVEWAFLTGEAADIRLLAGQIGLDYAYDAEQDQYAHPAVLTFVAPDGKISRYIYGLVYNPRDIKFALVETGQGKIGTTVDRIVLSCFHYDPELGTYAPFAVGIMRLGGVFILAAISVFLAVFWRRDRRRPSVRLEAAT